MALTESLKTIASTVLIADDNHEYRELLATWIKADGHAVIEAADGEEALEKLAAAPVDLVLLDVVMPRRTGFSACRVIKDNPKTRLIPVVLVTALDNRQDRLQGIESGADDFIGKPVMKEELLARVRSLLKLKFFTDQLENAESILFTLALGIEANDSYTAGHSQRVCNGATQLAKCLGDRTALISVEFGLRIGLPSSEITLIRRAGLLHDLGKLGVPVNILRKRSKLNANERQLIEQHPLIGAKICSPLKTFQNALPIVRNHHERLDGSGYPDGLKGTQIPLMVQVVSVADVFDALTSRRTYRNALSPPEAIEIMRNEAAKGWWDSQLIEEYAKVVLP